MRLFFILLIALLLALTSFWLLPSKIEASQVDGVAKSSTENSTRSAFLKARSKAVELRSYAVRKHYNTQYSFLIEMGVPSGENRFHVFDLKGDSILLEGLVTHGRCNQNWLEGRKYGNEVGCGCTSIGKYKVGAAYQGRFGLAYKLHGLDSSNSNAFKRFVVLHSHECVPEKEVHPEPICQSDGCPTVSPGFLQKLKSILDKADKPILMWIYE